MASVERWAMANGYDYRSMGDELFDAVPDWYMRKVRGRMPIAADLARLQSVSYTHLTLPTICSV